MNGEDVISVKFEDEFRICPECGYRDGFHTMLKKEVSKGADHVKWLFICPSCHRIFDVGYQTDLF